MKTSDRKRGPGADDSQAIQRGVAWAQYLTSVCADAPPLDPLAGVDLLAMGDSWFHYFPPFDVLVALENKYGLNYRSVAEGGATLEILGPPNNWTPATRSNPPAKSGAHGSQLCNLLALLKALGPVNGKGVQAVLISAGGDDVATKSEVLESLLNPAASGSPINPQMLHEVVDKALRARLAMVLSATSQLCAGVLGRVVPIVIHGYAHPVPDGRGAGGPPWLKPSFEKLGYGHLTISTQVMAELIDGLNAMQQSLIADNPRLFGHVRHVDVRPALSNVLSANAYQADWQNELHPTIPRGFTLVADRLSAELGRLPRGPSPRQPC